MMFDSTRRGVSEVVFNWREERAAPAATLIC